MYLDRYRQKIIDWVNEGLSDRSIAEHTRVSPSTVRYWRERNGIVRIPKVKKSSGSQDKLTSATPDLPSTGDLVLGGQTQHEKIDK
jgi:transposase